MIPLKLIAGLGNPGPDYRQTRHNAGAWFIESLAKQLAVNLHKEVKLHSAVAVTEMAGYPCWLLIPTTFMNHSGQALKAFSQYYKITAEEILIVHDELDLPPGIARLKKGGGHGGHNGLRDIINHFGTQDFLRLRIGIGRPARQEQVIDYVLNAPSKSDLKLISQSIDDALLVIDEVVSGNFQQAMTKLHTKE